MRLSTRRKDTRLVHDERAQLEEARSRLERFREEVREIVVGRDERHGELELFDHVADVEVTPRHVLGAAVVLRVEVERRRAEDRAVVGQVLLKVVRATDAVVGGVLEHDRRPSRRGVGGDGDVDGALE